METCRDRAIKQIKKKAEQGQIIMVDGQATEMIEEFRAYEYPKKKKKKKKKKRDDWVYPPTK